MPLPATDVRIILTTAGSREEAERIARSLVGDHLAACVNIVPGLTSIYRWQGKVEAAVEILLLIKTTAACLDQVEDAIRNLHSYEVPEFLVLTPESAGQPYLDWLLQSTGPSHQ
jgi:periplasmic divalent cation tolerance protein